MDGISWPILTHDDKTAVLGVLERGILYGGGPEVPALEEAWAHYTGVAHAIAVDSCTSAIQLALTCLDIGPGDEVITTAFSFMGTVMPILLQGATPIFVDCDPDTYTIDVAQIAARITPRTRAMLPVHLHGLPADMGALMRLSADYDIPIVEDACQAHGARFLDRQVGRFGVFGCFSLNSAKTLPAGQGGLLITNDDRLADLARKLRSYGEIPAPPGMPRTYLSERVGFSFGLNEMTAALARSQLTRLDRFIDQAQHNAARLTNALQESRWLIPPTIPPDRTHIFHKYRARIGLDVLETGSYHGFPDTAIRDRLITALNAAGVPACTWQTRPLPLHPLFQPAYIAGDGRTITNDTCDYPTTIDALATTIILGTEQYPLCCQTSATIAAWAEAITRVADCLPALITEGGVL